MTEFWSSFVVVLTGILGIAALALLLSPKSSTVAVVNAASNGFSGALNTALNPFSGQGNIGGSSTSSGIGSLLGSGAASFLSY